MVKRFREKMGVSSVAGEKRGSGVDSCELCERKGELAGQGTAGRNCSSTQRTGDCFDDSKGVNPVELAKKKRSEGRKGGDLRRGRTNQKVPAKTKRGTGSLIQASSREPVKRGGDLNEMGPSAKGRKNAARKSHRYRKKVIRTCSSKSQRGGKAIEIVQGKRGK